MNLETQYHGRVRATEIWTAIDADTYDGPGSPIGNGSTAFEAVEDLKEQLARFDLENSLARLISQAKNNGVENGGICRILAGTINRLDPNGAKAVAELIIKGMLS